MNTSRTPVEVHSRAGRQLFLVGVAVLVAAGIVLALVTGTASPAAEIASPPGSVPPADAPRAASVPEEPDRATSAAGSQDKVQLRSAALLPRLAAAGLTRGDDAVESAQDPLVEATPPAGSPPASGSGIDTRQADSSSTQLRPYTWQDGDVTRRVWLVAPQGARAGVDIAVRDPSFQFAGDSALEIDGAELEFHSEAGGGAMSLPGGVLLVLDPGWTEDEVAAFFADNGISESRLSGLAALPNAFFVETDAGLPSLNLANALASQEGVVVSSPNWLRETTTR